MAEFLDRTGLNALRDQIDATYAKMLRGTTAYWTVHSEVSAPRTLYIYTDYKVVDGQTVPGLKIGDGVTRIDSLPFLSGGSSAETYDGAYEVDPRFFSQTLSTKDRILEDDVTVNPIEVSSVENLAGGNTVYIGGNINYG